jgi:hypothetical protein
MLVEMIGMKIALCSWLHAGYREADELHYLAVTIYACLACGNLHRRIIFRRQHAI